MLSTGPTPSSFLIVLYKNMCKTEDEGGRPIHRAREWQKAARRLEKERKSTAWQNSGKRRISAPLIIDPTAGRFTEKMKVACQKFGEAMDMDMVVKVRAGRSVKTDAKSEPLRKPEYG